MISAAPRSSPATPFRLTDEHRQFAECLMHQQLYMLGRDIVARGRNLLLSYGCQKFASSIPTIPSIYIHRPQRGIEIGLRGFGVFVGDKSHLKTIEMP